MEGCSRIGMATSKHVHQRRGVDGPEKATLRRKPRRPALMACFKDLATTETGLEACAGSPHLARELGVLGHRVKLLAPQLVMPDVKLARTTPPKPCARR